MKYLKLFEDVDELDFDWDEEEEKPRTERLKEGWVNFTRFYCTDGFIDYWRGDSVDNPNRDYRSNVSLNSTASYFRLNNETWIHKQYFKGSFLAIISKYKEMFTSEEIWEEGKR